MHPRIYTLTAAALFALGCTHVIRVPTQCAPPEQPIGHSAIGWERVRGPARVTGKVLSPSLEPIAGATVGLTRLSMTPSPTMQAVTNALGEFSFEPTPPSRYFLVARRLSYLAARDTIQLAADSGAVVAVTLAKHPMTLDDCSLTYTTKRVPWWQQ